MADDPILKMIQGSGGASTAVAEPEEEDPILQMIKGPAAPKSNLRTPTMGELAATPGPQSPQGRATTAPPLTAGMTPNSLDASQVPLNPFPLGKNQPTPPNTPTLEENQAAQAAAEKQRLPGTQAMNPADVAVRANAGLPVTPEAVAAEESNQTLAAGSKKLPLPYLAPGTLQPKVMALGDFEKLTDEWMNNPNIPKSRTAAFAAGSAKDAVTTLNDMFFSPIGAASTLTGVASARALSKAGKSGAEALQLAEEYQAMSRAGATDAELLEQKTKIATAIAKAAKAQKTAVAARTAGQLSGAGFGAQGAASVMTGIQKGDLSSVLSGLGQMAFGASGFIGAGADVEKGVQAETAQRATEEFNKGGRVSSAKRTVQVPEQPQQPPAAPQLNAPTPETPTPETKPETIGAGEKLTPEKPETQVAQVDALEKGTNPVVYFPKGTKSIPPPPENANVTVIPGNKPGAGTYYHDDSLTPADIKKAVKNGTFGELLGHTQTKEEATEAGVPAVVVARDAAGNEIKSSVVDNSDEKTTTAQAQTLQEQFPESTVTKEPAEKVIAERQGNPPVQAANAQETQVSGETPASQPKTGTANDRPQVKYKPSEKAATMSAPKKDYGPEFNAQQWQEEINRNKEILANPKATDEDRQIATERLRDAQEAAQKIGQPEEEAVETPLPGEKQGGVARGPREKADLTKYDPQVLSDARQELKAAADLAGGFERPGRYHSERPELSAAENDKLWYGVTSPEKMIGDQFPWYGNRGIGGGAEKFAKVVKKGKGELHDRLLDAAAQHLQAQKDAAKKIVAPHVEELKALADQVRDVDPGLADSLEGIADGRYYSVTDLHEHIASKITEATAAAAFNGAFEKFRTETADAAEGGEREPGADESVQELSKELPEHDQELRENEGAGKHAPEVEAALAAARERTEAAERVEKKPTDKILEMIKGESKPLEKPNEITRQDVVAMGKAAFEAGLKRVAASDPKLKEVNNAAIPGKGGKWDAWYEGWDKANLAAPVETNAKDLTPGSKIESGKEPVNGEATQSVGRTGERALEGTPSEDVRRTAEGGNAGRASGERGEADGGRTLLSDREGNGSPERVGSGERESPVPADRGGYAKPRREPGQSIGSGKPGNDYRITDADAIGAGGAKEKFRGNVSAIKLLKQLLAEGRNATPEEQSTLVKYTGWGWSGNALFNDYNREWAKERQELQSLLSDDEYRAARASTTNAHYTSPGVIKAVWKAVERMGFNGGRILEPSAGIGHFLGLIPSDLIPNVRKTAIELDPTSGNILKQLYQSADTRIQGFEKFNGANNFYDLAISNVPFGDYKLHDPAYNKYALSIHNYFITKMLDKVRPGGLVAAITSHYTMDNTNSKIRQIFQERGDLVGAIRLPNTAFQQNAGTEVTTDMLFFRKRAAGEKAAGEEFTNLAEVKPGIRVNEYFEANPHMALGEHSLEGTMYGAKSYALVPGKYDVEEMLPAAIERLPENVMEQHEAPAATTQKATVEEIGDKGEVKPFGLTIKNGTIMRRRGDTLVEETDLPKGAYPRLKSMLLIRDSARELFQSEGAGRPAEQLTELRNRLNRFYDSHVLSHGYLHQRANMAAMRQDPDLPFVLALENWDDLAKKAKKSDAFYKQTVAPRKPVTSVSNPKEAMLVSLAEKGHLDFDHMAKLSGDTPEELQADLRSEGLIFESPEGHFETTDEYLSGNVRKKLREAEDAAALDPKFKENVEALKKVQPIDVPPGDIKLRFGSSWIPTDTLKDFINEVIFDGMRGDRTTVRHVESEAIWKIDAPVGKFTAGATQKWGTARANAIDMLEGALNLKQPTVYDQVRMADGTSKAVINEPETLAARDKLEQLENEFQEWMFRDPKRATDLASLYNEKYNSVRLRDFDGSHLTLPGMSAGITLRPHQKNAIWRAISSGNTGFFHVVGAGKTYTIIGTAMEMRRLGLAKKPVVVVPNHLVGQWAQDFQRLYPQSNVLAATKKDFEKDNRKEFASRIGTGDWDAVIIPHKSFEYLPMSEEFNKRVLNQQLDQLESLLRELTAQEGKRGRTVKQLEKSKRRLEAKIEARQDKDRKDNTVKFEDLGIDSLMVDEAHAYKNLMLVTKMGNVAGVPKNDSNRAFDMYMKTKYISEVNNGRNVVFATGTPISNTMAEIYTMMRYLDEKRLEEMGLSHFDAWAATFGKTVQTFEVSPEDVTRFRVSSRFSKFINLPELVTAFRATGDVKLAEDLNLPVPKLKGGKPEMVVVPASARVLDYVSRLGDRADHIRGYKEVRDAKTGKTHKVSLQRPDPSDDNMLKITGEGRKVALDYRAINPAAPDEEDTKINAVVRELHKRWESGKAQKLTQAVMLDMATPKAKGGEGLFNAYADIKNKLVGRGVPAKDIAFIHDAKTDKAKQELFDKVNAGEVRIVIGSTDKMGVGTNIQRLLKTLHQVDAPWRPSDIEQRAGRIMRQGNTNEEIEELRYLTEGSFDAYMWQGIERKAGFIRDVMKGDPGVREAEDVDGVALSYGEAKALATGNPLVAEKMKVDLDVQKLEKQAAAFNSQQATNKVKLASIPEKIAGGEDYIKRLEADIATRDANKLGDKFQAMVAKGQYDERKDAGAAINGAVEKNRGSDRRKIGEFRGLDLFADGSGNPYVQGEATHYFTTNHENPLGTIQSLESTLRELEKKVDFRKEGIATLKQDMKTREAEVGKTFPKQADLDKLLARKKSIDEQLAVNSADPTAEAADEKGIEEVKSGEVADEQEPEEGAEFGAFWAPRQIQNLIDKALKALGIRKAAAPEVPLGANVKVGGLPTRPTVAEEQPPKREKEVAGNIRLDKLNAPEDVINEIRNSAKRNTKEFNEQRRGTMPFAKTQDAAKKLVEEGLFTEKELEKMKKGTALNAEELLAARSMLVASAKKVREAAAKIREDNTVDNVLAFQEALLRHDGIQKAVAGAVAEAGRALSQQRMVANAMKGKDRSAHERVLDALGGQKLSEEAARRLAEIPEDDPVALINFLKSQKQWTTANKIEAYWIANVLSSPRTPIKKVLGDVVLATVEAARRGVDVPVDKIMAMIQGRESDLSAREAAVAPIAYLSAIPEATRKAAHILSKGFDPTDSLSMELPRRYEFPGGAKNPFNYPGRALSGATKFFQVLAFQSEIHARAVRQAVKEKLKGDALKDRAAELVQHPTDEMIDAAQKVAQLNTYTEDPDALSRLLMSLRDKVELPKGIPLIGGLHPLRFIIPFVQIPYNLTKHAFRYSPLGAAKLSDSAHRKSPAATQTISRALIGSAIMAFFAYLAAKNLLTGTAPSDPAGRDEFYRSGKQPFSIRIGDRWVSYKAAGPFALTGAAVAAYHDKDKKGSALGMLQKPDELAAAMGQALLDESFMRGMKNVVDALDDPSRFAGRWASGIVGGFVPMESALRTLNDSLDPTVRDAQTMADRIKAGLPVVSKTVPAKLDALGRPSTKEGSSGFAALVPGGFAPAKPKSDVDAELARLSDLGLKNVGFAGKHIVVDNYKVDLTPDERREYQKARGAYLQSYLRQTFNSPDYKQMSDQDKIEAAEEAIRQAGKDAHEEAGNQILAERLRKVREARSLPTRPNRSAMATAQ